MSEKLLACEVFPGMFSDELAVRYSAKSSVASVFVPKDSVVRNDGSFVRALSGGRCPGVGVIGGDDAAAGGPARQDGAVIATRLERAGGDRHVRYGCVASYACDMWEVAFIRI